MFDQIQTAPPDPILGLTSAFKEDPRPGKINLGVGVYKDESGATPILATVKKAERLLLDKEKTKSYLPIEGAPEYGAAVAHLVLGDSNAILRSGRAVTLHTPGGTGALRVGADFLRRFARPDASVWVSDPTWVNHNGIFGAAGFKAQAYPYYDPATQGLAFDRMMAALEQAPAGDIVLLHGACHNPSGMDPDAAQWRAIAALLARRGLVPFLDFAYQGLGHGLEEDAAGVRAVASACPEMLVASSFSKNFGLYNERVGALTVVATAQPAARAALSHLQQVARVNYSNPASHGGAIVTTILGDAALRKEWEGEVAAIRDRIQEMRRLFVETLKSAGVARDFSFIARQNGMFSFSGLTKDQVEALKRDHAIYIVGSGRLNVAGMTHANMGPLCQAIAKVL
jgi:aromatic-amino-acid transaminase